LLGGRYVDELDFSPSVPTALIRHRVIFPESRSFRHRASSDIGAPQVSVANGERVTTWAQQNVEPIDLDDDLPTWFQPWKTVQISEFGNWSEVAQWAAELFGISAADREAVGPLLEQIRTKHRGAEAQALAATRFVQDEIRYLGIEMGRNSHEPRPPVETLAQRWGDCKDKTLLLVLLLRELGFDARPAMVNTKLRRLLDERLPSPFEFDHVIVQVRAGREVLWLDPTLSNQGGTFRTIDTPADERALIVDPETNGLTKFVTPSRASINVAETYRLRDGHSAALEIQTRYVGGEADAMRATLATVSPRDFARERLNAVAGAYPQITPTSVPAISDDRDANVITVTERYDVRDLRSGGAWYLRPRELEPWLGTPGTVVRTMPLAIDHPLSIRQTVTIHFENEPELPPSRNVIETGALRFESSADRNGRAIVLDYRLATTRDWVTPDEVARHVSGIRSIRRAMTVEIPGDGSAPALAGLGTTSLRPATRW
jgi:hypothetical protein